MKCCSCGQEIAESARFCTLCGARQNEPAPEPAPAPEVKEETIPVVRPEPVYKYTSDVVEEVKAEPEIVAEPVAEPAAEVAVEPIVIEPAIEPAPAPAIEPKVVAAPVAVAEPEPKAAYQPVYQAASPKPLYQLPEHRGLAKMFFLGLVTFGIYPMVVMSHIAEELNIVASRYDGQRTKQYLWACVLATLTLGVYSFVWIHNLCNRIGHELNRRDIKYKFSAKTFWLWGILGSLLIGIGPFIYLFKFCKATNLINRDYNQKG